MRIGTGWCILLLSESVIIFNLIAEGTQVQSVPGGIVFTVALLLCPVLRPHVLHRGGEKKIKVVVGAVTSVQHSSSLEPVMLKASVFAFVVFSCSTGARSADFKCQETFCHSCGYIPFASLVASHFGTLLKCFELC